MKIKSKSCISNDPIMEIWNCDTVSYLFYSKKHIIGNVNNRYIIKKLNKNNNKYPPSYYDILYH